MTRESDTDAAKLAKRIDRDLQSEHLLTAAFEGYGCPVFVVDAGRARSEVLADAESALLSVRRLPLPKRQLSRE